MSFVLFVNMLALFFSLFVTGAVLGAAFSKPFRTKVVETLRISSFAEFIGERLEKSLRNPILKPGTNPWTAEAVLNPAALVLGDRTHLVYRAIGVDGVSRLGYASSPDGVVFDKRLPYPVYIARNPHRVPAPYRHYSPVMYPSGGSWGGCEDPRMVTIDGRVYITFNMFDGWDFIRVAVISIAQDDFVKGKFTAWEGPNIISKPGQIQKNWVLFPEKIGGKFAILHSIAPKVEIAYRDSLEAIGTTEPLIDSWTGARGNLPVREGVWDSRIRSAGPPPIRTDRGWLLFYHANDAREPNRYKLGALLLDLDDPTKILHRANAPVLSPDAPYENNGKPGIVYACGAVVKDGTLYIYYGGADKVVCVATAPLSDFLDALMADDGPTVATTPVQTA